MQKVQPKNELISPGPFILLLAVLSLVIGLVIHIKVVHLTPPEGNIKAIVVTYTEHGEQWNGNQMRQYLNVSPFWPDITINLFNHKSIQGFINFFLILLVVFKQICIDETGPALLLLVALSCFPFLLFVAIEGLRQGASGLLSIKILICVTLVGQVMCIGVSLPMIVGPWYAYNCWKEVSG